MKKEIIKIQLCMCVCIHSVHTESSVKICKDLYEQMQHF